VPPQPLLIAPGVRDVEGERVLPGTMVAAVRPHSYNAWSFHQREAVKLQQRVPEARHGEGAECELPYEAQLQGRFREMDEKGRSLAADRRRKAKTKARSGYGDRGDRAE
jgi:hypothetical protein